MMIIGCDFSSQLAASELVGYGDRRNWRAEASACLGRRGTVLPASSGAVADRHGSHRQLSLASGFAERVGSRAVGGRCGADSCQLRAAAEDGQARCGADSEAAGGGRFPRIWMPSSEVRDLRQLLLHRYKLVIMRARVKNELQHLSLNK